MLLRVNLLLLRRSATRLLRLLLGSRTARLLRRRYWRSALTPLLAPFVAAILTSGLLKPALFLLLRRRPLAGASAILAAFLRPFLGTLLRALLPLTITTALAALLLLLFLVSLLPPLSLRLWRVRSAG